MIADELLRSVADRVESAGPGEAVLAELRGTYPGVHFSYCMDDDVGGVEPVLRKQSFNLYLVDGRDHCLKLTGDAAAATGLLVAELVDEA
ncbi:DUF6129 family protein [Methylogaea oryzae]|uniref:DUF6129 domain-containing protein n=1 Tax=Methylogaea oryzae TaxID=1295382 RepID=A0A8D5AJ41_9GAMM|nr:DUF6129 family protein [Methylogaea oryzae]BBL72011.1 hypothetical protein MoryE10_26170 [Methylogaea oryzae]